MPYDDPDSTDPLTLTSVEIEVDADSAIESAREMALCFVEEYARLGLSAEALNELFESRRFAGPTLALNRLGRSEIQEMIRTQLLLRGPQPEWLPVEQMPRGVFSLPVLNMRSLS